MGEQDIPIASRRGLSTLVHYALVPLLPNAARRIIRSIKAGFAHPQESLKWIEAEFARHIKLEERVRDVTRAEQPIRSSKMWLRLLLEHGGQVHGMELEDRTSACFNIEQRHPFTDRRMIELSFGLPENQRLRRDQKFVLRQAMRELLPELICHRRDKAEFSETLFRSVRQAADTLPKPRSEELGWVNGNRVRAMRNEMAELYNIEDEAYILRVWPLWMVYAIDLWLDVVFLGRDLPRPSQRSDVKLAAV